MSRSMVEGDSFLLSVYTIRIMLPLSEVIGDLECVFRREISGFTA